MCACELIRKKNKSERMTKLKLAKKIPNQLKWIKIKNIKKNKQKKKTINIEKSILEEIQTHLHT